MIEIKEMLMSICRAGWDSNDWEEGYCKMQDKISEYLQDYIGKDIKVNQNNVDVTVGLLTSSLIEEYYNQLPDDLKKVVEYTAWKQVFLDIMPNINTFKEAFNELVNTLDLSQKNTLFKFKDGRTLYTTFEKD